MLHEYDVWHGSNGNPAAVDASRRHRYTMRHCIGVVPVYTFLVSIFLEVSLLGRGRSSLEQEKAGNVATHDCDGVHILFFFRKIDFAKRLANRIIYFNQFKSEMGQKVKTALEEKEQYEPAFFLFL